VQYFKGGPSLESRKAIASTRIPPSLTLNVSTSRYSRTELEATRNHLWAVRTDYSLETAGILEDGSGLSVTVSAPLISARSAMAEFEGVPVAVEVSIQVILVVVARVSVLAGLV
jgi:hypothetical protein